MKDKVVLVSGGSRDFGRSLVWNFAKQGAKVYCAARRLKDAQNVCSEIASSFADAQLVPLQVDLANPEKIKDAASMVTQNENHLDILVNNGAKWLSESNFSNTSDGDIFATINSGLTGSILMTKYFQELLLHSNQPHIINLISKCGESGFHGSNAHEAFYAMKHGQNGFFESYSHRIKNTGIRVTSLYPPDFINLNPLSPEWNDASKDHHTCMLHSKSLIDIINFVCLLPRSCYISKIFFEDNRTVSSSIL